MALLESTDNVDWALETWYQMFLNIDDKHAQFREKVSKNSIANQPELIDDESLNKMS